MASQFEQSKGQPTGEKIMRRAALMWIALATAAVASPLAAQQTVPHEQASPSQPAPSPQTSTELPPPFPHYPARAPREHDPNYHGPTHLRQHRASHHAGKMHHHGNIHHQSKTHHQTTHEHFSKRTIRQCHAMTYRQIMRHRNCRVMMKQELEASEHRRDHAHRHGSVSHHSSASHHRTHHHRG